MPDPRSAGEIPQGYGIDWDEHFSVIAGFSEGGVPFGLTWDEYDPDAAEPLREPQVFPNPTQLSGHDRGRSELLVEIRQILCRQSNISRKNMDLLRSLARHEDPEVRRIASIAIAIARVHPRRRRRVRTIRAEHPKLWRRMLAARLVQEYGATGEPRAKVARRSGPGLKLMIASRTEPAAPQTVFVVKAAES